MEKELLQATTLLTIELLQRTPTKSMDATTDVIASAFEAAHQGLLAGLERVAAQERREEERRTV